MKTEFQRAKSVQNKEIRIHQIMEVTDQLFHQYSYHEISLSTISEKAGFARGGLYKYVTSKEEIFLLIYQEKQRAFLNALSMQLQNGEDFALSFAKVMEENLDFLKYHRILNAIIETNIPIERLAEFKLETIALLHQFQSTFSALFPCSYDEFFDMYLTFLYHGVYLYGLIVYSDAYTKAIALANLPTHQISFQNRYIDFIQMYLSYHFPS